MASNLQKIFVEEFVALVEGALSHIPFLFTFFPSTAIIATFHYYYR